VAPGDENLVTDLEAAEVTEEEEQARLGFEQNALDALNQHAAAGEAHSIGRADQVTRAAARLVGI
jgi:hypothetical protein